MNIIFLRVPSIFYWLWQYVCTPSRSFYQLLLTLWRRSSSKCYLRIQSVPQREHHTSPLQRSTG
jgi:hypothetical protein